MEIQKSLSKPVEVKFENRPLSEVMDTLGRMAGVNMHLDPQGLHAEGVTSDTPVTINLTQPISLKSALNLILQPTAPELRDSERSAADHQRADARRQHLSPRSTTSPTW